MHAKTSDVECRAHLILEQKTHPSLLLKKIGACSRHGLAGCQELVPPVPTQLNRKDATDWWSWGGDSMLSSLSR